MEHRTDSDELHGERKWKGVVDRLATAGDRGAVEDVPRRDI